MTAKYNWDIRAWIDRQDWRLDTNVHLPWVYALLAPVEDLHDRFLEQNQLTNYKVKYTSQQKVLASLLNDLFDPTLRRITVVTVNDLIKEVYTFFESESPPVEPTIYFKSEAAQDTIIYFRFELDSLNGFIVNVPADLIGMEDRIKAWVNRYRLAHTTFRIVYI